MVEKLRSAAGMAAEARSHAELREAAEALAAAQQLVGLDRWARFVADAERRASDPATIENVAMATKSESPLDRREEPLGHPQPVENILETGAALLTGGGSALVKAISRKIIERIASKAKPAAQEATAPAEATPARAEQTPAPGRMIAGRPVAELSDSGRNLDPSDKSGQLTKAGRALQKHGSRADSNFAPPNGNKSAINEQGQNALDKILDDPDLTVVRRERSKGFDVYPKTGGGARFNRDGKFTGFLEPDR